MSRQPEALRLADELDSVVGGALCNRAAAELRRLHAECDALRAKLIVAEEAAERCKEVCDMTSEGWRAECDALRAKYDDLILSVGNKCPGESRHETAKRYIYQAERADSNQKAAALKEATP